MVISVHNKRTRDSLKDYEGAGGGALLRHRSGDAVADCSWKQEWQNFR